MRERLASASSSPHLASEPSMPELPSRTKPAMNVTPELTRIYETKIKPLEEMYAFDTFHSTALSAADVAAKPIVLLMGQYSVGKTTFIKHLLGREYLGAHIGPEPTTDRFIAIMDGPERTIPGNAAAVSADLPFTALSHFGVSFLNKFQVAQAPVPALDSVILIDTPGILSGEKQRIGRAYDFPQVIEWFAQRADMILLLFDAHKLDISDEFKEAIMTLRGHDDKIRVVLNKADMITGQQLMRVYGALMWSLGKVMQTPEVARVYIGSFWDQPLHNNECEALLKAEQRDLFNDIKSLPRNAAIRKINEIVKRARLVQVHALIVSHLRHEMPSFFGKESKQNELLGNLSTEFQKIQRLHNLSPGDFPNPDKYRERLADFKLKKFPKLDKKSLQLIMDALGTDLPNLIRQIPEAPQIVPTHAQNPFASFSPDMSGSRLNGAPPDSEMYDYQSINRRPYVDQFKALAGSGGDRLSGPTLKHIFETTGLDMPVLAKIWTLSDWTKDGYLDIDEFVVAMHLCDIMKRGWLSELPSVLPELLKPKHHV
ncbi:hypothetical protein BASA50_007481 [Batrachochytrium salamandrivorans]|uniref:P-loop containing nucleoside triphosphate hydrolase protein n=1 Tax=Batrachochytrium salamandrivorans TaxID=1357716 RepID=A0ABQ8F7D8_9FUNG|nr:hypothetical protein BASA60_005622 [Batrachochytrium salamandrivorans]KAH6583101.1 hypothetical protein BASA61_008149 [Batrachochytrium salamandrivorans]KAH6593274.1 hypothetical protein BASA50_007481 [Batrachochytrium salamandrivorans]KAH9274178.1 hypothetical protein BASA83_003484 [Batrachochytrium salamandrivorans]